MAEYSDWDYLLLLIGVVFWPVLVAVFWLADGVKQLLDVAKWIWSKFQR